MTLVKVLTEIKILTVEVVVTIVTILTVGREVTRLTEVTEITNYRCDSIDKKQDMAYDILNYSQKQLDHFVADP